MRPLKESSIEVINSVLLDRKMSGRALAQKSKLDPSKVNRILNHKQNLNLDDLEMILGALEVSAYDFFGMVEAVAIAPDKEKLRAVTKALLEDPLANFEGSAKALKLKEVMAEMGVYLDKFSRALEDVIEDSSKKD